MGAIEAIADIRPVTDLPFWQLRTMLALLEGALRTLRSLDELLARHPVLHETLDAAAAAGLADLTLDEALARLDERGASPGPLARLGEALGLSADGVGCFVAAALADDDPRLAPFIDDLHGRGGRPTRATLARVFGSQTSTAALQALRHAACLREGEDRSFGVSADLWDLASGLPTAGAAWFHRPASALLPLDRLILPPALRRRIDDAARLPADAICWVLRGSAGSGRHALAGALARAAGLGLVEAASAEHLPALGAAAALLGAMPLASFEPAPGEAVSWTPPAGAPPVVAARLPRHGGLALQGRECRRIDLEPPAAEERRLHWLAALGRDPDEALLSLRLPRATLHRVARRVPEAGDGLAAVIAEVEEQGRFALDGIAGRVAPATAGEALALPDAAREEFDALVARCRHRDRLAATLPAAFGQGSGVRALFKGASGTGKTLAARHLATALQRPLYRVDLAATVSKYIGETERNLERVFEAAESLDIVLLLDEGDALLAGRTGVANATDRYANLETNYLLQRLESYSGVLVITTNAAERIDAAFARRIDVTIEFPLPDALTRLELWQGHLGTRHAVAAEALEDIALRCALSGGQIRNAALHAALLAIEHGSGVVGAEALRAALEREYRKAGQHCPSFDDEA